MTKKSIFILCAKSIFFSIVFHLVSCYSALGQLQQFVALDPNGAGGFELGTTFTANGWSTAQITGNSWVLATNNGYISGTNRAAFIRHSGTGAANYSVTTPRQNFFYRDVTIPSGYTNLTLSFLAYQGGVGCEDNWDVYIQPILAPLPVANNNPPGGCDGLVTSYYSDQLEYINIELNDTLIGKTFRLVFSWQNSGSSTGSNPPAIIDNIELIAYNPIIDYNGGTFTIDNTQPTGGTNFNNFADAINEINRFKSLPVFFEDEWVTFNVMAGQTFTGNCPPILVAEKVKFQRSGAGPNPVIFATGGTGTSDAGITVGDGNNFATSGITFDGIDIIAANNSVEFGYLINGIPFGKFDNFETVQVIIRNADIRLDSSNIDAIGISATNVQASTYNNLNITNCGLGGILINQTSTLNGYNNKIYNVVIGTDYTSTPTGNIGGRTTNAAFGIRLNKQEGFEIYNCTIRNIVSSGVKRGIWVENIGWVSNSIYNNRIYGISNHLSTSTNASRGIEIKMLTAIGNTQNINIYNNYIGELSASYSGTATATRLLQGILMGSGNATTTINTYYNTVVINGNNSITASNSAIEWGGNTAIYNVRNNNLVNLTGAQAGVAKHYLLVTTSATSAGASSSIINNNNYFISNFTNGFTALRATTDVATLASWRTAITAPPNIDLNTFTTNPLFVNLAARNFTPQNDTLNNAAPISVMLTDINGLFRSTVKPDIGAVEFTPPLITTNPASVLTAGSVIAGGVIVNSLTGVTSSGVVFSLTNNIPQIGGTDVTVVNSSPTATSGTFNIPLSGLVANRTYYMRSFATNSLGTHYGNIITFRPDFVFSLPFVANFDGSWNTNTNGWSHTRFFYSGNGIPTPLNAVGPKDWQQNKNIGSGIWSFQGLSSNPNNAVTDSGALWLEDSHFASSTGTPNVNYSRIETPIIDLSGSTNPYIRFYYFANQPANYAYPLMLMASNDNGQTWKSIMRIQPNADVAFISSTGIGVMLSSTPWQRIAVKIPDGYKTANTKFAFSRNASNGLSGNLFIDSLIIGEYNPPTIRSAQSGLWSSPNTWIGGIIPNGTCNVVIDSGHTINSNVNISRMQNLTLRGTFTFSSSSTEQTTQIFGNLNILSGGRFNLGIAGNRNIARSVYLGEGLGVSGILDLGSSTTHSLLFVGGISSVIGTYTGGVITNDSISTPGSVSQIFFANSGGITVNHASVRNLVIRNMLFMIDGPVTTNSKLTAGVSGTDLNVFRANPLATISSYPFINLGNSSRNLTYGGGVNGNFPMSILSKDTIITGNEAGFVRGTLTLNTQYNVRLNGNLLVGDTLNRSTAVSSSTGVGGGLFFQRGILITNPHMLTVGVNSNGSIGTDPEFSNINPPQNHGSYILGKVRFVRPSTGSLTGSFSIPFGIGSNLLGSSLIDNVKRYLTVTAGGGWSGQVIECELLPARDGFVNPPQTSVIGSSIFRVHVLENRQLPATSSITLNAMEETGKTNRDIFYGSQNQLFIMQAPNTNGPWSVRSVASGAGTFAQNTIYTRTTSTTSPGPISGNGSFFAFGTMVPVMHYSGGDVLRNTTGVAAGNNNVQMLRIRINMNGVVPRKVTMLNLNANGSTNVLGITNAKIFFTGNDSIFNTGSQIASAAVPTSGVLSLLINQQLSSGNNYFWVAYDIGNLASSGQLLVANLTGIVVDDTLRTPASIPASGGRTISSSLSGPMTYLSSTTIHPNLNEIVPGSINNQLMRVSITTSSNGFSIPVTQFTLNVNGSTNPLVNIDSISVWYTGSDSNFNAPVLFGKTGTQSGAYFINGSQFLFHNNNYFWVTYNITNSAEVNGFADAELVSFTIASTPQLPAITAPVGFRLISAEYCRSRSRWSFDRSQIWNVTMGTLNNNSNCSTTGGPGSSAGRYSNYTTTAARPTFTAGTTVSFSVRTSTCSSGNQAMLGIWIDYNNDGNFNGPGEQVHISPSFTTGTSVFRTGSITIPLNMSAGLKRMRVVLEDNASTFSFSPCREYSTGETEDYLINILSTASPMAVSTVTSSHRVLSTIFRGAGSVITTNPNYENDILRINVVTSSTGFSIPVTQFNLSVNGTQNPLANIDSITVWYSGGDSTFPRINYFGGISPQTGAYTVRGSQGLLNGNNYFWVLYNIADSAILNDFVDAEISALTVAGIPRIPTVSAPVGSRRIDIDYCTSVATNPTNNGEIWNVTVGSLNNSSTCATTGGTGSILGGYSNYTSTVAPSNLNAGSTVPFSIRTSTCGSNNAAGLGIWIDFNNDGDFLDAGETLHISTSFVWGTTVFRTGTLNIPLNVTSGLRRMRVVLTSNTPTSPCSTYNEGETEDYLVNVVPASPPMTFNSVTAVHPNLNSITRGTTNNAMLRVRVIMSSTGTPVSATQLNLSVNGSANPLTNIDSIAVWYTGANANFVGPVFFGGTVGQSGAYTIGGSQQLLNDTNYFWVTYKIPNTANINDSVDAEISSITIAGIPRIPSVTAPAGSRKIEIVYCASAASIPTVDGEIFNITVGTLNNSSTCTTTGGLGSILGGYSNYTATVAPPNLSAGTSVPFSVHTSTCGSGYDAVLGIWIDFNSDGDFTDIGEQVHMSPVFTYGTTVFRTGTLNIPTNVAAGLRRMRVIMEETGTSPILSCGVYGYGETEDYLVNIVPPSITYVWNQTLPGSFTTASNWTPARNTPSITDRLVFNNGANITINNVITQTVRSITVANNTLVNFNAIAPSVLSATDTLALTSGRLICATNTELTLGSSAAIGRIVGSGTIQGALTAWVNNTNNSYSFPLSQANLARLASINLNIAPATSGTIRVNFVSGSFSSAGIPYNDAGVVINKLAPAGFWSITTGNGFSLAPTGSYSLSLNAAGIIGVNNLSSLRISRRANSSNPWDTAGANAIATGTTASPVANRNLLRVFGEFTIGSDSMVNPLPVNLLRFDATEANGDVLLNWTTGSEKNNKGFEIEKSEDGKYFKNLGFVKGMGNSNIEVNYSFLDRAPFTVNDVLYYRLKQIDFDGSYNLSKILKVERKSLSNHIVSAYPIPFNTYLKISIDANTEGLSKISMYDIHSRIVKMIEVPLTQGKNELMIHDVEMLSNGAYFIKIEQNGKLDILKIMKQ